MAYTPSKFGWKKPKWNPDGYWKGRNGKRYVYDDDSHGAGVDRGNGPQEGHWDEEGSKNRYHNDGSPLPGNSDSTSKEKDKSDKFIGISNTIYDNESSFAVGLVIACAGMICFACLKDNDILGYYGVK